ncbi:bifunctional 3'-5' exonuclease/DNA polymerase [Microbacterium sp. NPDC055683]
MSDGGRDTLLLAASGTDVLATRAGETTMLSAASLAAWIAEVERRDHPRWVWSDTTTWYPRLLAEGVRVERCHDLRLARRILRLAAPRATTWDDAPEWDRAASTAEPRAADALFEWETQADPLDGPDDVAAEHERQRAALDASPDGRLRLLVAAESAGALVACEMRAAGLPWDVARHEAILVDTLGVRRAGGLPARMEAAAARVRDALDDPRLSIDSPPKLLRALRTAGIRVESTSRWELAEHDHPVVEPLLAYKRMARLLTANGWSWIDEWVRDGRFRPVYVPGGVVTGRWASSGGGALQIPRALRPAVRADEGWRIVSADVAQLEPRVLAAMARDERMAQAAAGADLYAGIVASGAVPTRAEAKIAVLGAMYGATTGDAGRLVPRLRTVFPRAMALVDAAAQTGEDGGVVRTWLGRTSPAASSEWDAVQRLASGAEAGEGEAARARRAARDRGRFTRNFVVQGTAAEWSLAWLADLRLRLAAIPPTDGRSATASGPWFDRRPHLAFFLHDEVLVHTPEEHADEVAAAVRAAAAAAGRLLFGAFPIDFPLDVRIDVDAAK